jgi:hypothetical protein
VHQFKFVDTNKMVPTDLLKLIAFFEQFQAAYKPAGVLEKIAKDKKQPKEKMMAHLPAARSCESDLGQMANLRTCRQARSGACRAEATSIS